jgi:hypothetical protein
MKGTIKTFNFVPEHKQITDTTLLPACCLRSNAPPWLRFHASPLLAVLTGSNDTTLLQTDRPPARETPSTMSSPPSTSATLYHTSNHTDVRALASNTETSKQSCIVAHHATRPSYEFNLTPRTTAASLQQSLRPAEQQATASPHMHHHTSSTQLSPQAAACRAHQQQQQQKKAT